MNDVIGSELERGAILNQFRRELSLVAAKLGNGQRQAAERRAWAKCEHERPPSKPTGMRMSVDLSGGEDFPPMLGKLFVKKLLCQC